MKNDDREKAQERAEKYLYDFLNAYRTYHNHKERTAYVSFLVYFGFFASALLFGEWPLHHEDEIPDYITIICVTVFWVYALIFMKWQLRNRRIAAIYVAAAQEALALLLSNTAPTFKFKPGEDVEDSPKARTDERVARGVERWLYLFLDHFWPYNVHRYISVDVDPKVYPVCLTEAIAKKSTQGTGAIVHERLLVFLGWSIYLGIVARILLLNE